MLITTEEKQQRTKKYLEQKLAELSSPERYGYRFGPSEFAKMCNIPQSSMSRMLNGKQVPSDDLADAIARGLNDFTIYELLEYSGEEIKKKRFMFNWEKLTQEQKDALERQQEGYIEENSQRQSQQIA